MAAEARPRSSEESQALRGLPRKEAASRVQAQGMAQPEAGMERQAVFPVEVAAVRRIFRVARAARQAEREPGAERAEIAEEIFQVLKAQAAQGMAAVRACAIGRWREVPAEATRAAQRETPAAGRTQRWVFAAAVPRAEAVPARWPWKLD